MIARTVVLGHAIVGRGSGEAHAADRVAVRGRGLEQPPAPLESPHSFWEREFPAFSCAAQERSLCGQIHPPREKLANPRVKMTRNS